MGIKGLAKHLRTQMPHLYRSCGAAELRGKRIAIDVGVFLHQFTVTMSYPQQFLHRFRAFAHQLTQMGIGFIFVFDGPSTTAKGFTLSQRATRRDQTFRNLGRKTSDANQEEARLTRNILSTFRRQQPLDFSALDALRFRKLLWQKKTQRVTRQFLHQLRDYFVQERIPFLIGDLEGEKACAWLAQRKMVDYVASEDYDTLACGAPYMLCSWTGFIYQGRPLKLIALRDVLTQLRTDYPRFVDACVLAGSDFSKTPLPVGFPRALALVEQHHSLQKAFQSGFRRHYASEETYLAALGSFVVAVGIFSATHLPFVRSVILSFLVCLLLLRGKGSQTGEPQTGERQKQQNEHPLVSPLDWSDRSPPGLRPLLLPELCASLV